MRITLMTTGTRGDLEPFLALGRALQARGHSVNLATGREYHSLVAEQGLQHSQIDLPFLEIMKSPDALASKNGDKKASARLRRDFYDPAIGQMIKDLWKAAQGTEVIVSNHAVYFSRHIADKLGIPFIFSSCSPFLSPTREFPFMFLTNRNLGPWLNRLTYMAIHLILPMHDYPFVKQACQEVFGHHPGSRFSSILKRQGRPIPLIYHFSPHLLNRPRDWPETTHMTGYWPLERQDYKPPEDLLRFLEAGPPPLYLGFGSMVTNRQDFLSEVVARALRQSGQRAVLCAGEGGIADPNREDVYYTNFVPFDWLFPRVQGVVHHGGTGVTHLGLRYGKPTVICPVIADQEFWAKTLHAKGLAPAPFATRYRDLSAESLADAMTALRNPAMQSRAAALGDKLSTERALDDAVALIESYAS